MKKIALILLLALLQITRLCAQEDDTAVREFANKKVPASVCCGIVSFNVSLITINDAISLPELNIHADEDSVAPGRFRIKMNYFTKYVDSVTQYFDVPEEESGYNAKVYMISVKFKSKTFRDTYLKKLGAAVVPGKRWDFWMDKTKCKGVQVYSEGTNSVKLHLITDCSGG